jgi:hypothetical protein
VPQAAEHAAAASPNDEPVAVPAGHADQDRARVPPHDQRLGFQVRREPAERRVQRVPHPLPGVVLPLHDQRVGGELPGRELGTGGQPGVDERQGGVVDAGQVRGVLPGAVLTGPGLIGTAAKPTRVLWTADAAGVVTR